MFGITPYILNNPHPLNGLFPCKPGTPRFPLCKSFNLLGSNSVNCHGQPCLLGSGCDRLLTLSSALPVLSSPQMV